MAGGVDMGALSRGREDGEMMSCLVKLQKAARYCLCSVLNTTTASLV